MAGIQIDGVNNKIDFDDDLDTSISANTDDTLVIEAGGNTMATITATTFTINDGTTITTADNTDTLSLISTDADASVGPNLRLYRNSSSPANDDATGAINFIGRNDNSQDVTYASIRSFAVDVSDGSEDGLIAISIPVNGTSKDFLKMGITETVFNEDSADLNFRVESDGNANMLFVDGGTNRVGVGTSSPPVPFSVHGTGPQLNLYHIATGNLGANFHYNGTTGNLGISTNGVNASSAPQFTLDLNGKVGIGETAPLGKVHIKSADSGMGSVNGNADELIIEGSGASGLTILSGASSKSNIFFGDSGSNAIGDIGYDHSSNALNIGVNSAERMRITSTGQVLVGATSGDYRFEAYNAVNGKVAKIYNGNNPSTAAPYGLQIGFNYTPNNGTSTFLDCEDTLSGTTVNRLVIYSNGDVFNRNNEYGQISDARIKDNITDANSQWDDIKAIKVRNFELKDDIEAYGAGNKVQIGVVAQELESVSPGLIKKVAPKAGDIRVASEFGTLWTADDAETKDGEDAVLFTADDQEVIDGENSVGDIKVGATHSEKVGDIKSLTGEQVKGVSYSVLYMKAIKALQEAQTRIETLETKVAALEG